MYQTEDIISKFISTEDEEKNFRIRYFRDESVGIITTETDKSYFLLDSADYWYDLIQENYPPIMKCSCKNDRFNLIFDYTPRAGTDDFREINITCQCTVCGKAKRLPTVEIDSPSSHLLENPITFCKQPKIKYKTYSIKGFWSKEELLGLTRFFLQKNLYIYCLYWDVRRKRCVKELSEKELHDCLADNEDLHHCLKNAENFASYLKEYEEKFLLGNAKEPGIIAIYFSAESLDDFFMQAPSDEKGIVIRQDLWRKKCIFLLNGPSPIVFHGLHYEMKFCSEYPNKDGTIVPKSPSFRTLVQEFREYSINLLEK